MIRLESPALLRARASQARRLLPSLARTRERRETIPRVANTHPRQHDRTGAPPAAPHDSKTQRRRTPAAPDHIEERPGSEGRAGRAIETASLSLRISLRSMMLTRRWWLGWVPGVSATAVWRPPGAPPFGLIELRITVPTAPPTVAGNALQWDAAANYGLRVRRGQGEAGAPQSG